MFDVLENNSGKICLVLVGATLAGGAILVFGAPAFAAAYVSLHAVEILTVGSFVGAAASGASYERRESASRRMREQANNRQENLRRSFISSDAATVEQQRGAVGNDLEIQTEERLSAIEADNNSLRSEMRRLNGLYRNLSRGLARQEIEEERRRYEAGDYSDSDSSTEESKQPLLSERNMFQRPVTRAPMEIAANDDSQQRTSGVVHRRRVINGSN
jgi:hypothetical protein